MPMYNLIEYSGNYAKTSDSLGKYCRDEPGKNITNSESETFKSRFTNTGNAGTVNVKIAVPSKFLSNFWRALEMLPINCEITLDLTWSSNHVIYKVGRATSFEVTDTKLYVPVVTLSTQGNEKLLQQLKSDFKRTLKRTEININQNYQCRHKTDYLIDN